MSERSRTASPAVQFDTLAVRYPGRSDAALHDISIVVEPGEWLGIAGRTGAGKSTLALAVAGFIPRVVRASVGGQVLVDGTNAIGAAPADLLGRVGIVFSTPANQLSGSKLTVREELAFGLENLGVPRSEMDGRIDVVMARLGIDHLAHREPSSLSAGEQQRVAIAGIVTMGPGILVLDEPTAELD
ncbi:MAG: ABC transporter ATP-binding protein, partial [Candidatus Limnocylindrales bacterium]